MLPPSSNVNLENVLRTQGWITKIKVSETPYTSHKVIYIGQHIRLNMGCIFWELCRAEYKQKQQDYVITWSTSIKSWTSGIHCPFTLTVCEHQTSTIDSSFPHPAVVLHSVSLEPVKCNTLILNVGGVGGGGRGGGGVGGVRFIVAWPAWYFFITP